MMMAAAQPSNPPSSDGQSRAAQGPSGDLLADRIREAEAAVALLAPQFLPSVREEVAELKHYARLAREYPEASRAHLTALFQVTHNVKGQGGSFGFDLISQVAESLCEVIRESLPRRETNLDIVDHHIRVLDVITDRGIQGDGGQQGARLIEKLRALKGTGRASRVA